MFEDVSILKILKLGATTAKKLQELGISTVGNLNDLAPPNIKDLTGIRSITATLSAANSSLPGSFPYTTINHRKEDNPYILKYAAEDWDEIVSKTITLSPFVSVKKLVKYIMEESTRAMGGTVHKGNLFFIHYALSLMATKTTMEWMYQKGYKAKWLVPQNGVNTGTRYHGRPVGNSPKFMPLDNSLNTDVTQAHDMHVSVTIHLPKDDPMKLSNCTPQTISRRIKHIVESVDHGCPSSSRIIQCCNKALDTMFAVYNAEGGIVPGLADQNGLRYSTSGTGNRGGVRVKNEDCNKMEWL